MATQKSSLKHPSKISKALYHSLESGNNCMSARKIDEGKILLELQKGDFNPKEVWFIKDGENHEYVMIPQSLLQTITQTIARAQEDKLKVELERDVATHAPIDFDDVMIVAIKRLEAYRKSDGSLPKIDTFSFVSQIKKEYPNLFFNLEDYFGKQNL